MKAIATCLLATACTASVADGADDDDAVAAYSYVGQSVIAALDAGHHDMRGRTWDFGADNRFDAGWIVQTPVAAYWGRPVAELPVTTSCAGDAACDPDFDLRACSSQTDCTFGGTCTPVAATVRRPGDAPRSLCVGHSDGFVDDIYTLVTSAQRSVDISSLAAPDGRFEAALRNAITYLSNTHAPVRVRYLYGAALGDSTVAADVLASLTRDLLPSSSLRVSIGAYRDGPESWNHAKIISVDGARALVGGHNMWTRHYLQTAPVHDLSLVVSGSAAAHASRFVDDLWRYTCKPGTGTLLGTTAIAAYPAGDDACELLAVEPSPGSGGARVIAAGRLGAIGDEAGDDAIVALVDAARTQLRLSLQDIGPVGAGAVWPETYLRSLVAAVGRGVDVELVLTNLNARPDGLAAGSASYSNGWTPADVTAHLAGYAAAHPELGADAGAICAHVHATTLRPSTDDAWPGGATFANHAKLAVADDLAFYLGSQNWYPSDLSEFGYVVDDPAATRQLLDGYFTPLWTQSQRVMAACAP